MTKLVHSNSSEISRFAVERKKKIRSKTRKLRRIIKQKKLHSTFAHDLSMPVCKYTNNCMYYVRVSATAQIRVFYFFCLSSTFDCGHWCYNTLETVYYMNKHLVRSCDSTDLFDVDGITLVSNQIKSNHIFILHTHTNTLTHTHTHTFYRWQKSLISIE